MSGIKGLDKANLTGITCTNQPEITKAFLDRQGALVTEVRSIGDVERGGLCVCETLAAMHGLDDWNKYPPEDADKS